jgi:hypothetical protein
VLKARDKRKAIFGVIEPLSLTILEAVFLETSRISPKLTIVMDKGFK